MSKFKVGDRVEVGLYPGDAYTTMYPDRYYKGIVTEVLHDGRVWVDNKYFAQIKDSNNVRHMHYEPIIGGKLL